MIEIAPSILSADFARLGEEIRTVEQAGASLLHVDVMDGRFVPNITVGLPVVKAISRATRLPIDAHLMIVEPGRYAEDFVKAGAQMVSIHIEADPHAHRTLSAIRAAGGKPGLAFNPATPLSALEEAIKFADYVLLMSVNPGFGGQAFIPESLEKVRRLRKLIDERGLRGLGVLAMDHAPTLLAQRRDERLAQHVIVFDEKYGVHGVSGGVDP